MEKRPPLKGILVGKTSGVQEAHARVTDREVPPCNRTRPNQHVRAPHGIGGDDAGQVCQRERQGDGTVESEMRVIAREARRFPYQVFVGLPSTNWGHSIYAEPRAEFIKVDTKVG